MARDAERMAEEKAKPTKLNITLTPEVAAALRRFAFESTGQMRGVSEVAEKAIREYLERQGMKIEGQA